MPSPLVSPRFALALVPVALLVPLLSSPLSGLAQLPACTVAPGEPFSIASSQSGDDELGGVVSSSLTIERSDEAPSPCFGVDLLLNVAAKSDGSATITLPVTNNTSRPVRVTADLRIGKKRVPVLIGTVKPGGVTVKTITVDHLGSQTQVSSGLFVGPA